MGQTSSVIENVSYIYAESDNLSVPIFAIDSNNVKTRATAEQWAGGYNRPANKIAEYKLPNNIVTNLAIYDVSHRMNNIVYKVIQDGKYKFDMYQDSMLDIIKNSSIVKGVIECPMIWLRIGSQTKIYRMHSEFHDQCVISESLKGKPIPTKELKSGYLYKNRCGDDFSYFGRCEYKGKKYHVLGQSFNKFDSIVLSQSPKFVKECGTSNMKLDKNIIMDYRYGNVITEGITFE